VRPAPALIAELERELDRLQAALRELRNRA
jgi:hypothetical protein